MASIRNLHLEIFEQAGFAVAKVRYEVRGSRQDVLLNRRYREVARLIADDGGPGEDGVSDEIRDGIAFDAFTVFRNETPLARSETVILPSAFLDEDRRSLVGGPLKEDEIRLQVTLTHNLVGRITAASGIVRRGGPVNAIPA